MLRLNASYTLERSYSCFCLSYEAVGEQRMEVGVNNAIAQAQTCQPTCFILCSKRLSRFQVNPASPGHTTHAR
jgi:hypothetical protein